MVSTPDYPDPYETANAQSGMNTDTAITQQSLNMVDQVTPWGSVNYDQTGTTGYTDSQGNWVELPQYTATTTLSPEQQAIYDEQMVAMGNLASLAADQSASISELLSQPFEYTNRDAELWAYDLASPRILEQQAQNEAALRSTLANKGIREGSAAWNAEMARLTNANTDQLNQLALEGREMGYNEARDQYTLPINTITALMSGSQVTNPNTTTASTPSTSVAGVDYTGLVTDQYQAELQQSQSAMGGLFGLLGAGVSLFSDRRLKTDIRKVGTLDSGLAVYSYRYVTGGPTMLGVMADEVAETIPDAVSVHDSGYAMVDYGKVH